MDRSLRSPVLTSTPAQAAEAPLRGNILIVDDTPINLKVLAKLLTRAGHQVRPALDGRVALEAARALPPDLVLLDVNMPGMSGYELCAAFKQDPLLRDVPIVFLSASDEKADKLEAFQAGAVDYVTKPFDAAELLLRVRTHLALVFARKEQAAIGQRVTHELGQPLDELASRIEAGLVAGQLSVEDMLPLKDATERIQTIVRSMLALSQLHEPQVPLAALDVQQLLQRSLQGLRPLASAVSAHLEVPSDLPPARGYGPWVEQIWTNAIIHVVKQGGRPPQLTIEWRRTEDGMIEYVVRDRGRGLPPAEPTAALDELARLGHLGGHGRGLVVVEQMVTRMHGAMSLESTPGGETALRFCLPAA